MKLSRYSIISRLRDSDTYFIVNLLSGQADILESSKARAILEGSHGEDPELIEKGYLVEPREEEKRFKQAYLEFLDRREGDEIQIFFVPWYSCNFGCSYCYQDEYQNRAEPLSEQVIEAFFDYIDRTFAGRRKYITIFGGEPLLPGRAARSAIQSILTKATDRHLDVAVVTNGYELSNYIELLSGARIREIQVTLDGPEQVHNRRRPLKGKSEAGTFRRIVDGIDHALDAGLKINLRVVLDRENIDALPELARFAIEKGWTRNPLFKTQFGRNYELHHCQADSEKLFSRVSLWQNVYELAKKHPEVLEFHAPAFSVSRFLMENGRLPDPLFDACPGGKTEWAFDYTGTIYSCTATVGKQDERLGTFYPIVSLNEEAVEEWDERDITSIDGCRECPVSLACGGGCASVAKNSNGKLHSKDCRPVKELLELGIAAYFSSEVADV